MIKEVVLDRRKILNSLPFGEEALFIDKVVSEGETFVSLYKVRERDCAGHFDSTRGFPSIFPGHLVLEFATQTVATSILAISGQKDGRWKLRSESIPMLAGSIKGEFVGSVSPNETISGVVAQFKDVKEKKGCLASGEVEVLVSILDPQKPRADWREVASFSFGFVVVSPRTLLRLLGGKRDKGVS